MTEDERLRALFEHARDIDLTSVPGLGTVVSRRRAPRAAATSAGLVLFALAAVVTFPIAEPPRAVVSIAEWRSPTAFLLETTDDTILWDVPEIGTIDEEEMQ